MSFTITPEMAMAAVSLVVTAALIRAQKRAREKLYPFAERALAKAKEQFDQDMMFRGYDQTVYDYVKALPLYSECQNNIHRGHRNGHFQQTAAIKQTAFGSSRYNCGDREEAILNSLSIGIIAGGEAAVDAFNFEDTLIQSYLQQKYVALSNSAGFRGSASGVSAFGNIANSYIGQSDALTRARDASVATFTYAASKMFLKRRKSGEDTGESTPFNFGPNIQAQPLGN